MQAFLRSKYTWLAVLVLIIACGVWFMTAGGGQMEDPATTSNRTWGDTAAASESLNVQSTSTYSHPQRNFSFVYPDTLQVGRFEQANGETIVVQNPDKQVGFQISIRPVDENITMSKQRIQEDLPDLQVSDPQPVRLGADAGRGLAFISDNEAFGGDSREVWFTFNNYLYQISTYASMDPLLQKVLDTWTFR
jgi:hypothetical protein